MNCFISTNTDIYYNLALEEFLLKERSEDFFFLWRSEPVVVVGKHQNPYKELDYHYALENGINVARRLSGGGTVSQDLGNINFTFVKNTDEGKQINLKQHSKPIFDALRTMGLDVQYSKRNDLLIDGKKFSGNAEHVYKNRVLHHGTLLFDSDLDRLSAVLKSNYHNYTDKTIASVKSKVVNLGSYLPKGISAIDFQQVLFQKILLQNNKFITVETPDLNKIKDLRFQKYSTLEWIYLYTPKYELNKTFIYEGQDCTVRMKVVKGIIIDFQILGYGKKIEQELRDKLLNQVHLYDNLEQIISTLPKEFKAFHKNLF